MGCRCWSSFISLIDESYSDSDSIPLGYVLKTGWAGIWLKRAKSTPFYLAKSAWPQYLLEGSRQLAD